MAALFNKVWRQIESPLLSVDALLLEEQSCHIFHPDPIWNDGALDVRNCKKKKNRMSDNVGLVPDAKTYSVTSQNSGVEVELSLWLLDICVLCENRSWSVPQRKFNYWTHFTAASFIG